MDNYKVIVAHPGKQHSYRMATAIKRKGLLFSYITTVYDKNSHFMKLVKHLVGKENAKRASSRRCEELMDHEVVQFCELRSMFTLLLLRIDKSKRLYNKWNRYVSSCFGKKVADYAIQNKVDMVIMYDSNASDCFEILKEKAPHILRVMDTSHSNRLYEKELFEKDMEMLPAWGDSIKKEKSYLWETDLDFVSKENNLTQYFIVPSEYVKRTLLEYGILPNQMFRIPYGVDTDRFSHKDNWQYRINNNLTFIYVGNATEMKGFGHLLEALLIVNTKYPNTDLHLVGDQLDDDTNYRYGNHVISHGYLQFDEMAAIYEMADVMVFPSLSEGMTLSGLEALCSGVPLICTENSGINDLIIDEKNGFVVQPSNAKQIAEKMIWFIENKDKLPNMKRMAYETGIKYTWDRYYQSVGDTVLKLCKGL